jgi:hypothetical protein
MFPGPSQPPSSAVEQLLTSSLQRELQRCRTYGDFMVVVEEHLSYLNDQQTGRVLKQLTDFALGGGGGGGSRGGGSSRGGGPARRQGAAAEQQLHALLRLLCGRISTCAHQYAPRQVASALSAFAKLRWQPPVEVTRQLLARLAGELPRCNDQDVSMALWSLAKLGVQPEPQQLAGILEHVAAHLPRCSSQSIANITWSLVGLRAQPCAQLLAALDAELVARLGAPPAAEAGGSYAVARGAAKRARVVPSRQQQAQQQALTPQGLSNVLWAFAKLGQRPSEQLLAAACEHSAAAMSSASPQSLSNLAWALAQLQAQPRERWQQQLWRFTGAARLQGYSCHNLATLLLAVQQLRLRCPPGWAEQLTAVAAGKLHEGSPENLAVLLAALAALEEQQQQQGQQQQHISQRQQHPPHEQPPPVGQQQEQQHEQEQEHGSQPRQQQRHDPLLRACWQQLASPWLAQASPRDIASIAAALVRLQQRPPQAAADNLLRTVFHSSPAFSPRDLVQVSRAAAVELGSSRPAAHSRLVGSPATA